MTSLRSVVRLPARPVLAVPLDGAACARAFPGLQRDDVINITGGVPDGSLVFGVVRGSGREAGLRESWLPAGAVRHLSAEEAALVPASVRLTEAELLQKCAFVRVTEDWQDADEPATLAARSGEVLQLGCVREGWGFAWQPEGQGLQGWLPLAVVQKVEPSWAALSTKETSLVPPSAAALVDLLKEQQQKGQLPLMQQVWEGEPPASVMDSARSIEKEWKEEFARRDAEESARAAREAAAAAAERGEGAGGELAASLEGDEYMEMLAEQGLPEDDLPLVVCKTAFTPPRGTSGPLLQLHIGDLVRVTSIMSDEVAMYHGFLERKRSSQGWFPRKSVQPIEDRWDGADSLPTRIGAPPLPQVPQSLQRMLWA